MGAEHVRLLTEVVSGVEVAAVYDVDRRRADTVAASSGARALDDPMVLIKEDTIDCVLIASSDATHEQFVLAALAAAKPVLCEKPLAPDPQACLGIVEVEAEHGRRLVSLGFMRRFDAGFRALREQVRSGAIGTPLIAHCIHRNIAAVGVPSALLISGSLVHEIDTVRWLLDDEFESVTVHTPRASSRAGGTQDPVVAVLRTRSGVHIDAEVFVNAGYGYDVRCELVGETGSVALDAPTRTVHRAGGIAGRSIARDWRDRFEDAYRRELQSWVDAVATGTEPPCASAWDGYVASAVAGAGVRALETGTAQDVVLARRPELYR
jgi:myo-inositol 2-dehydrogenase/D-chiro-inositol 1-dehydrogenase